MSMYRSLGAAVFILVTGSLAKVEAHPAEPNTGSVAAESRGITATVTTGTAVNQHDDHADHETIRFEIGGRNPRVLFIITKDCERCDSELARLRKAGGAFERMQAKGWIIGESDDGHLQIIDRDQIPEIVEQLNVREYPTVAAIDNGEIVRSFKEGCTTPLDAWTFGWLIKGVSERPAGPISEKARVETTNHYRLRGNHWTIDGNSNPKREVLISHLRGANHAYGIAANWQIETWSYEELRSLHDDLHEREMADNPQLYYGYSNANSSGVQFGAGRKAAGR